jgi:hypothetical protein
MPAGLGAAILTALITQGGQAGAQAFSDRRAEKLAKSQGGLQNVLQSLNPKTQGQQPAQQGGGFPGAIQQSLADPLVQKVIQDLVGKMLGGQSKTANQASLPDPRAALGGGRFGMANNTTPGQTTPEMQRMQKLLEQMRGGQQGLSPVSSRLQGFQQPGLLDPLLAKLRG